MKFPLLITLGLSAAVSVVAQNNDINPKILTYINKYKDLAIQEQLRTGVPAAIKLAQGIHETASGTSELCNNAKNHFGIKCKSTWTGETYAYDDDAKGECFRKYNSDYESYLDHSNFLMGNKRYAGLFNLDVEDYKGWARGLKAAGYATNAQYANLIIATIEKYNLHQYTLLAKTSTNLKTDANLLASNNTPKVEKTSMPFSQEKPANTVKNSTQSVTNNNSTVSTTQNTTINAAFAKQEKSNASQANEKPNNIAYNELTTKNGLKGFYAPKGEHLLGPAEKFKIRYSKLLKLNELNDAPLEADMFIYLDKKLNKGLVATYTVKDNETLSQVSQNTGVGIEEIRQYNNLVAGVEPKAGSILNLQTVSSRTPEVYIPSVNQKQSTKQEDANDYRKNEQNYIATNKGPQVQEPRTVEKTPVNTEINEKKTTYSHYEQRMGKPTESNKTEEVAKKSEEVKVAESENITDNKSLSPYEKLKRHMEQSGNKAPEVDYSYDYTPASKNTSATTSNTNKAKEVAKPVAKETAKKVDSKKETSKTYTVKKGDTLFSIAKANNVTVDQLQKWNNVTPKTMTVGKKLIVKK